jgi:hypothetical protein
MNDVAVAMGAEIDPPVPTASKSRKARAPSTPGVPRKKGASRPYRKISAEVLAERITKLTTRLQKAKKQHESTRVLLTKYSHERFYRDREAIESAAEEAPPAPAALDDTIPAPAQPANQL